MPHDVDITVGADTSAFATGMSEIRNSVAKVRSDIANEFARPFQILSIAGIVAGLQQIVNKGEEIHHLSQRFGIDAEKLQALGNAGKESGTSIETMARAMNKLIIAQQGALDGSDQQVKAFQTLGVSVEDLRGKSPDQLMLMLADGVKNASDRTEAYAAVATLLGSRFGTDLIPMLEKGSTAILEQAKAWSTLATAEVEELHRVKVEEEHYLQRLQVFLGKIVSGWGYMFELIPIKSKQMWAQITGDTKAAADAAAALEKFYLGIGERNAPPPEPNRRALDEGGGGAATDTTSKTSSGGAGIGRSLESLQSRLDKLREERFARARDNQEELNALLEKQWHLELHFNTSEEEALQNQIDQEENRKKIEDLQKKINDDQQKYNDLVTKARAEAEEETVAAERRNEILQLEAAGHSDIAEKLQIQWEFEDKIADLTDDINEAWTEGNQELAEQLTSLRDEVEEEKKLTEEARKRAEALKSAKDAQKALEQSAEEFNRTRSGISSEQQDELRRQGKSPQEIAALAGLGTGIATLGRAVTWTDQAELMATNPTTGVVDQNLLTRYRALQERNLLLGRQTWSVQDIMARQKALELLNERQYNIQAAADRASQGQLENYLSLIASGRGGLVPPSALAQFPQIAGLGSPDAIQRALEQLIASSRNIERLLTPMPGGH
jgi:hypothetical protein